MLCALRRFAASLPLRAGFARRAASTIFLSAVLPGAAHAVIVRGHTTDALGQPVAGAKVQLIQGPRVIASAYSDANGFFEARTGESGRFRMLSTAPTFLPAIGEEFYGSAFDVLQKDVVLAANTVQQETSVTATGTPTPLPQLTAPVTLIPGEDLSTRVGVVDEMRQSPGVFLVQTGQAGAVTSLFMRGAQSDANKVLVDGVPAEDVGGSFDFGTPSSTGIASIEMYRGPDSALYGTDALASVVAITTPRGATMKPVLNYSGDAGSRHAYRNEAVASGTHRKLDYLAGYSFFETSNAEPNDEYHSGTAVGNLGYALGDRTSLRATVRYGVSAEGVPGAYKFHGISANAKEQDQDLYTQGTAEHTSEKGWHNLVRYGVARKREEFSTLGDVGTPITSYGYTTYYGNPVLIRGANGYATGGQAAINYGGDVGSYLQVSDRDELYYQSDYAFTRHVRGLFGFRYEDERGVFRYPLYGENESLERRNFEYTGEVQGDYWNRLFFSLGGAVEKNHLYGVRGTPRLGLAFVPVKPGAGLFRGTKLRFNVSRGVQEPNLTAQFGSLYGELLLAGNTTAIQAFGVTPIKAEEARTYDYGVDQNLIGSKLILKAGYFHSQYDHEVEYVSTGALKQYFGIPPASCTPAGSSQCTLPGLYGAYLNSLTFRAQGLESELNWQVTRRIFVRGGYTYLASLVERSFSSDALRVNGSTTNPLFPGITIGSTSPLVGQRPFRRPPNTGFVSATYSQGKLGVALRGAFAGKSDDSTFLGGDTPSFDNTLLLPNRNLDFGYAKLDVSGTYAFKPRLAVFVQLENLTSDQHIGPIGYPSLPLTFRAGLKVRLGGDE